MISRRESYYIKPLILLESSLFDADTITHGMFARFGGYSEAPHYALNVGFGVGDNPGNVVLNRMVVQQLLGLSSLVALDQVHGDRIAVAVEGNSVMDDHIGCDAVITSSRGIGLMIQQADCQALLLHDPRKKVIAAVHCGWRGSVRNIIAKTVQEMQRVFHTDPADLLVVISPSLGPCCAEFIHHGTELPEDFCRFLEGENHFNFWEISRDQLVAAGVQEEHIEVSGVCTACDSDFFSHRRSVKKGLKTCGRGCSVIALREKGGGPLWENRCMADRITLL